MYQVFKSNCLLAKFIKPEKSCKISIEDLLVPFVSFLYNMNIKLNPASLSQVKLPFKLKEILALSQSQLNTRTNFMKFR